MNSFKCNKSIYYFNKLNIKHITRLLYYLNKGCSGILKNIEFCSFRRIPVDSSLIPVDQSCGFHRTPLWTPEESSLAQSGTVHQHILDMYVVCFLEVDQSGGFHRTHLFGLHCHFWLQKSPVRCSPLDSTGSPSLDKSQLLFRWSPADGPCDNLWHIWVNCHSGGVQQSPADGPCDDLWPIWTLDSPTESGRTRGAV